MRSLASPANTLAESLQGGGYGTSGFVGLGGADSVLHLVQKLFVLH